MKYEKPDGYIQFAISGCCCPPDSTRNGLHTNSSTQWLRIVWRKTNDVSRWLRLNSRIIYWQEMAQAAETAAEFLDAFLDTEVAE